MTYCGYTNADEPGRSCRLALGHAGRHSEYPASVQSEKRILCAYCGRNTQWPDGFPVSYDARCWRCWYEDHQKAEHPEPRKARRTERALRRMERRLRRLGMDEAAKGIEDVLTAHGGSLTP